MLKYRCVCVCVCTLTLQQCLTATLWTVAARLLCPWNSPGKNTVVGCHGLLQGTFLTWGSNSYLLLRRGILYHWKSPSRKFISTCYVQLLSRVWLFATPWTAAHQASLSITISQSLFKLTSFESVMPANNFVLCRLLLLLPSANFQCLSSSFYE